jgi:hypothetical protein
MIGKSGQSWAPPDPHFGDVFIDDKVSEALMIITPECDLMYAPEVDAGRPADPDRSVVMLPGHMQASEEFSHLCEGIQTSFVQIGSKKYVIDWDLKKVKTTSMTGLRQFMDDRRLKRKLRLKHPFSAWAQMAYLDDAARIPVPIGPPVLTAVAATIYFEIDGEQKSVEVGGVAAVAYLNRSGEQHLRPKVQLVSALLETAEKVFDNLDKRLEQIQPGSNDEKRFTSRRNGMLELLTKLEVQESLLKPFIFASGTHTFGNISLEFVRDKAKIEGKPSPKALIILIEEVSTVADAKPAAMA